jgi:hypothetical protein
MFLHKNIFQILHYLPFGKDVALYLHDFKFIYQEYILVSFSGNDTAVLG